MALSDWDTLAFDTDAQPCIGDFVHSKIGSSISIYRNWLYVHCEKMWVPACQYTKPTIAQIISGSINLAGFEIESVRGPQESIFIYAYYTDCDKNESRVYRFGGIGCYGFKDIIEEVLKNRNREIKEGETWCSGIDCPGEYYILCHETLEKIIYWDERIQGKYNLSADWVGVLPSTLEKFFEWLTSIAKIAFDKGLVSWIEKCKATKALRFNQGNLFISQCTDTEVSATQPGQSEPPIVISSIEKIKT